MSTSPERPHAIPIVLISGLSGAGKTLSLKALEDLGYFSIDNLPCSLLDPLVMLLEKNTEISKAALVMDGRDPVFFTKAEGIITSLRNRGHDVALLFLEADAEAIFRRFAETRRPHPMARNSTVAQGYEKEKNLMAMVRQLATHVVDTSNFNVHQLKAEVVSTVEPRNRADLSLVISSFGFKYGAPLDASIVFDVRYLPNPYFVQELRDCTGLDPEVANYVFSAPEAKAVLGKILDFLVTIAPLCFREGRSTLAVSIGCTGGQHRSVAFAETTSQTLREQGYTVTTVHRDLSKAS